MLAAAGMVVGEHDFTSFAAVDPERVERMEATSDVATSDITKSDITATGNSTKSFPTTNVRTIYSSSWRRDGEELIYTVRGSGFLHHMVRNLVGTFLLGGEGNAERGGFAPHPRLRETVQRPGLPRLLAGFIWSGWSTETLARPTLPAYTLSQI